MAEAYTRCATDYLCVLDGDLHASEANIAGALADAVSLRPVDMVVGQFWDPEPTMLSGTLCLYTPLMQRFFPGGEDRFGSRPLSGFRALRVGMDLGAIPPGYGLGAHLNCQMAITGAETAIGDIDWYGGAYRRKDSMASEIASGVRNQAERCVTSETSVTGPSRQRLPRIQSSARPDPLRLLAVGQRSGRAA